MRCWHNILRKYHWQQGMSADTIHREGNWILNDAARMGNRVWKSVSQAFFTQGPDVASARLADFKSRSKSASTELERQWGKIGRGEGDEYLKARSTARDLLHGAENAVDSASSALWDLVKVVEGLGGKSEPLLRQQAAALPKMRYAIWTIRQTLR